MAEPISSDKDNRRDFDPLGVRQDQETNKKMKYTIVFKGYVEVDAENDDDAILKAFEKFNNDPNSFMEIENE